MRIARNPPIAVYLISFHLGSMIIADAQTVPSLAQENPHFGPNQLSQSEATLVTGWRQNIPDMTVNNNKNGKGWFSVCVWLTTEQRCFQYLAKNKNDCGLIHLLILAFSIISLQWRLVGAFKECPRCFLLPKVLSHSFRLEYWFFYCLQMDLMCR